MSSKTKFDRISGLGDFRLFRRADLEAYNVTRWRFHYRLVYPGLYYQRILRSVELLYAIKWRRAALVRHAYLKLVGIVLGISVPPGVFGRGLSIPHYGSVIVNDKVRAGRYCRIHSGTNLGEHRGSAPNLGDGVYIGPGAVAYGRIQIGAGSVVAANAVVNTDVPVGVVVAGVPARIISSSNSADVMPSWIPAIPDA
ncbi:serine acetyltransferase [Rhodococcus sp. SJ-3]|uniref:serine acetyltransferase n=1 Tax=Rhodococcus sp. SJ-3 TaxID=3454628 RepID=UPI003F7990DF